jgi:ABC-2 type transport system permease protein
VHRIWAVMSRELRAYFDSIIAYVILLAFFVVTTYITMSSLEEGGQASLRPFFDFLPAGFLFFIPAVAMRLWAEERRLGTIELLLTWPLKNWDIVLGKFLAGLVLIFVLLTMTTSYALYVTWYGNPDPGPLVGGYIAALLLGGAYLALGCFISSITEHQIVAYVVSVFLSAGFFLCGYPPILASIPPETVQFGTTINLQGFVSFLSSIGFGSRFGNVARGVIDFGDLAFYLAMITAFLYLNVRAVSWHSVKGENENGQVVGMIVLAGLSVLGLFSGLVGLAIVSAIALGAFYYYLKIRIERKGVNRLLDVSLAAALAFVVAIQFSALMDRVNFRKDLTEERAYSLSPITEKIAAELEDPLEIRCYFSESLPLVLKQRRQRTEDMLSEYATASKGRISIRFFDPDTDNSSKDRATREGVNAQMVNINYGAEKSSIKRFFGCVLEYQGRKEIFQFMPAPGGLESEISAAIRNLVTMRKTTIGLLSSQEKMSYSFRAVYEAMKQRRLPVQRLKIAGLKKGISIPSNIQVLVLIDPEKMSEREAYEIDQFVMRGGSLVLLANGVKVDSSLKAKPVVTGLETVLASYGFEIKKQILRDNDPKKLETISFNAQKQAKRGPNPFAIRITKETLNKNHPITRHLSQLSFNEASPIEVITKDLKFTELVRTSKTSFSSKRLGLLGRRLLDFVDKGPTPRPLTQGEIQQPIVALAYEGILNSCFRGRRPPAPEGSLQESNADSRRETIGQQPKGRIIIFADSNFIELPKWGAYGSAGQRAVQSGGAMVLNSVDWIVSDEDLIELRNRGLKDRRLRYPKDVSESRKTAFVYFLGPILLLCLGGFRWFFLGRRNSALSAEMRRLVDANPVTWNRREAPLMAPVKDSAHSPQKDPKSPKDEKTASQDPPNNPSETDSPKESTVNQTVEDSTGKSKKPSTNDPAKTPSTEGSNCKVEKVEAADKGQDNSSKSKNHKKRRRKKK